MSRLLPPQPNLEHLKKEAKSLQKAHASGNPDICQLLRLLQPFANSSDEDILAADVSLTDIQYALAKDYGFVSWQELRQNVQQYATSSDPLGVQVDKIMLDAIKIGASDVHLEPFENTCWIRYRIDGILHEIGQVQPDLGLQISALLKSRADLDLSERRIPQQGWIRQRISKTKTVDFRIATLPVLFGEKISLRIVDRSSAFVGLERLGFEPEQLQLFLEALHKPAGLLLVTGPAGSGKTVLLYNSLTLLNKQGVNISTIEDPVEIVLDGIDQCLVNPGIGMDYAKMLSSIMMHDPDIVYVADIPDFATADTAFKAALSGHLILGAMFANSAPETIVKLGNMGVPSFQLSTAINLVVAQRLARRLCEICKIELDLSMESLLEAGFSQEVIESGLKIYGPGDGCDECKLGYKGRIGIFEVVKVSGAVSQVIRADGDVYQISDVCQQQGFSNLIQSGLKKVQAGITSLGEIKRITTD